MLSARSCSWSITSWTPPKRMVPSLARLTREYPQGLLKLEPGDFARLVVRRPESTDGARSLYRRAVEFMISGDREAAQVRADDWLGS